MRFKVIGKDVIYKIHMTFKEAYEFICEAKTQCADSYQLIME